ncbi:MAG: F0F1 ATP synthase subunit B [Candidatus Omnitrophota bacterium]
MELLRLLNANELIAQIIAFLVFLAIMRVFLWKKFLGVLDKRREAVADEFKRIEESKETLSRIKNDYENKLSEIGVEAKKMIQEASDEGRKSADQIIAKAERDAEKMIENAKESIKDEMAKAKEELKDKVVDLTIQVAEKIIQEKLSEKSDRKLVEDFIGGIGEK